eukprot:361753-Chlamydomonas_euryale.AAC.5
MPSSVNTCHRVCTRAWEQACVPGSERACVGVSVLERVRLYGVYICVHHRHQSSLRPVLCAWLPPSPLPHPRATCVQIGVGAPDDVEASVLLDLLSRVASKPCFHALRTVQRLGYSAGCAPLRLHRCLAFVVRVQSPGLRARALRGRIDAWLHAFA